MTRKADAVCLLVGGPSITVDFADAVERMIADTGVEITRVVIAESVAETDSEERNLPSRLEHLRVIRQIKRSLVPEPFVEVTSISAVSEADIVRCAVEPADGVAVSIPDDVVDDIAAHSDVVIHEGVGILSGRILSEPERGVLGFHHGDIREYRGIGYGFWEYMHGDERSGVTLQRLNETLDAGEIIVLRHVDISDADTYSEVRRRLGRASVPMLATGIRRLQDPEFIPERVPEAELGTVYYSADIDFRVRVRYVLTELYSRTKGRLRN